MLRRAYVFLLGALITAACAGPSGPSGPGGTSMTGSRSTGTSLQTMVPNRAGTGKVAILLPLSGPMATVGQPMLQAAQLALPSGGGPTLIAKDTAGTPDGAAASARAALTDGADLILGPLTAAETSAVAPIAREAGVPILAFTNASGQAQPTVWTLGITPGQQVRRLVAAAVSQGKNQFAALLPDNDFGRALGDALGSACAAANLPAPTIYYHTPGTAGITEAARNLSAYGSRRGPVDAQIKAARAQGTIEGRRQAAELAKARVAPPPFNALLLGDVRDELQLIAAVLPYFDVDQSSVQYMGPAQWAAPSSGAGVVTGAWYAAPDPAARAPLEEAYTARYGAAPPPLADLAYDAASIARVLAGRGGYSASALTQPSGFAGVDGWLELMPDGQVRRGLAVFRIERGGPAMVEPAPQSGSLPGV